MLPNYIIDVDNQSSSIKVTITPLSFQENNTVATNIGGVVVPITKKEHQDLYSYLPDSENKNLIIFNTRMLKEYINNKSLIYLSFYDPSFTLSDLFIYNQFTESFNPINTKSKTENGYTINVPPLSLSDTYIVFAITSRLPISNRIVNAKITPEVVTTYRPEKTTPSYQLNITTQGVEKDEMRMIATSIVDTGDHYIIYYNGWQQSNSRLPVNIMAIEASYDLTSFKQIEITNDNGITTDTIVSPDKGGKISALVGEDLAVLSAYVMKIGTEYFMFYSGDTKTWYHSVGLKKSADGINFKKAAFPVFTARTLWDSGHGIHVPKVIRVGESKYRMYYNALGRVPDNSVSSMKIAVAESSDLLSWKAMELSDKYHNLIYYFDKDSAYMDAAHPFVVKLSNNAYEMYITAPKKCNDTVDKKCTFEFLKLESPDGLTFSNPKRIMQPNRLGTVDDLGSFVPLVIANKKFGKLLVYSGISVLENKKVRICFAKEVNDIFERVGCLYKDRGGAISLYQDTD